MQDLFGQPIPATSRRKPRRKKTGRSQYRRRAWEDFATVQLHATDLFDAAADPISAPTADVAEIPVSALRDDEAVEQLAARIREARVEVYRRRYEARIPVHQPGDHTARLDYVRLLMTLAREINERALADRGLRNAAAGVYPADPRKPEGRWRLRMWNPDKQRNEHVGYYDDEASARKAAVEWWKTHRKLDVAVEPPAWLMECLADARNLQADASEAAGGIGWDVGADRPDDD